MARQCGKRASETAGNNRGKQEIAGNKSPGVKVLRAACKVLRDLTTRGCGRTSPDLTPENRMSLSSPIMISSMRSHSPENSFGAVQTGARLVYTVLNSTELL
jgi:hypothetical protein